MCGVSLLFLLMQLMVAGVSGKTFHYVQRLVVEASSCRTDHVPSHLFLVVEYLVLVVIIEQCCAVRSVVQVCVSVCGWVVKLVLLLLGFTVMCPIIFSQWMEAGVSGRRRQNVQLIVVVVLLPRHVTVVTLVQAVVVEVVKVTTSPIPPVILTAVQVNDKHVCLA